MTCFTFDRSGNPKIDVRGEHVSFHRNGRSWLGTVTGTFRDEDETLRANVRHFNGEPWPFNPAVGLLEWIKREWQ